MKNRIFSIAIILLLLTAQIIAQKNANIYIQNASSDGVHYTFEIHITPTTDWGTAIQDALGDCSWYFDINGTALNNPTITYAATELSSANGYTNTTGIPASNKLQITTDLDFPIYFGYALTSGTNYHLYTVQLNIIEPSQTAGLSWDHANTGVFNASDEEIIENYVGSDNSPLPVELTNFSAVCNDGSIVLNWETATEVDNYGFEIERASTSLSMTNDVTPSGVEGWETVGFVQGHGNSNSPKSYNFTDNKLIGGSKFVYRLKQIDIDGNYDYSDEIEVEIIPTEFAIYQNYPNPFNPNTKIRYQLPHESRVTIKLYDMLGSEISTLLNEKKEPGVYEVDFSAQHLSSGTYIYRIVTDGFVEAKKMVLLK